MVTFDQAHELMSQANLIIQVVVLSALIVLSILLQRRKKFVWHGNTLLVVVMIGVLLTVSHMGPSFIRVVAEAIYDFNWVAVLGVLHGVAGVATLILGAWLVGFWVLSGSDGIRFCAPRKKVMRRILTLWAIALALGIAYYPLHIIFT